MYQYSASAIWGQGVPLSNVRGSVRERQGAPLSDVRGSVREEGRWARPLAY
jgi:hypothetical protein